MNPSKRYFAEPLSFLVYLYADCLTMPGKHNHKRTRPLYISWSDKMLWKLEKTFIKDKCFGSGEIIEWSSNDEDRYDVVVDFEEDTGENKYEDSNSGNQLKKLKWYKKDMMQMNPQNKL